MEKDTQKAGSSPRNPAASSLLVPSEPIECVTLILATRGTAGGHVSCFCPQVLPWSPAWRNSPDLQTWHPEPEHNPPSRRRSSSLLYLRVRLLCQARFHIWRQVHNSKKDLNQLLLHECRKACPEFFSRRANIRLERRFCRVVVKCIINSEQFQ